MGHLIVDAFHNSGLDASNSRCFLHIGVDAFLYLLIYAFSITPTRDGEKMAGCDFGSLHNNAPGV